MHLGVRSTYMSIAVVTAVFLTLLAGPAAAATTEIGAVDETRAGALPSPITSGGFAVQVSEAAGTYAVPPGYSTITSWRHSAGTTLGPLTFKVYRPTGATREFVAVASDTQLITTPETVHSFNVHIPVQPGDRIGLSSDEVQLAYESFLPEDRIGFFNEDVPLGGVSTTQGDPFPEFKLAVVATVESPPVAAPPPAEAPPVSYALPPMVPGPPKLTFLTLAPRAFAAARRGSATRSRRLRASGTKVSYRSDVAATVRFAVQRRRAGRRTHSGTPVGCLAPSRRNRRGARCTRYVGVPGSFTDMAHAGSNSFYFTGRIGRRTLTPGSYRLRATPSAGGVAGRPVDVSFRITRRAG